VSNSVDGHFGECPRCGGGDGYLNVGPEHWLCCHGCRVKWLFGVDVFRSWRGETECDWAQNRDALAGYERVETLGAGRADAAH
jgi:hypothetical protein